MVQSESGMGIWQVWDLRGYLPLSIVHKIGEYHRTITEAPPTLIAKSLPLPTTEQAPNRAYRRSNKLLSSWYTCSSNKLLSPDPDPSEA